MAAEAPADTVWMVLSNYCQARLMHCGRTPAGRCRVTEVDSIESPIPTHEHGRPCALGGMTGHSYAAGHHTIEEQHHRFAKQLSSWIDEQINKHDIRWLTVFAPERSIGHLRQHVQHPHRGWVEFRSENLMHLTDDALQRHNTVLSLLRTAYERATSPQGADSFSNPPIGRRATGVAARAGSGRST